MKLVLDRDDVTQLLGVALNRTIADTDITFKIDPQEDMFEVHISGVDLPRELPVMTPVTDTSAHALDVSATTPAPSEEKDNADFRELHQISEELVASVNHVSTGLGDRPLANNESFDYPGGGER